MFITNRKIMPIALPRALGELAAGQSVEISDEQWKGIKNNPVVKNWLDQGRISADQYAEKPDQGSDDDQDLIDVLDQSAENALAELAGADASDIARALELERAGKNRKGLVGELEKLLEPEA